jgi:hypothetical protein
VGQRRKVVDENYLRAHVGLASLRRYPYRKGECPPHGNRRGTRPKNHLEWPPHEARGKAVAPTDPGCPGLL